MQRVDLDMSKDASPPPSSPGSSTGGRTGALAASAAATLVREEIAHVLSVPVSFFRMLVGEFEAGHSISAETLDIAREELARLQGLITSLRATPRLGTCPRKARLASVVRATCLDLARSQPCPQLDIAINVPESIYICADTTALGFVLYAIMAGLAERGVRQPRISATTASAPHFLARVSIFADLSSTPCSVFTARGWMDSDSHAIAFATARRVARAAGMQLSQVQSGAPLINLEIPLATAED
jgi:hypothetical protein